MGGDTIGGGGGGGVGVRGPGSYMHIPVHVMYGICMHMH